MSTLDISSGIQCYVFLKAEAQFKYFCIRILIYILVNKISVMKTKNRSVDLFVRTNDLLHPNDLEIRYSLDFKILFFLKGSDLRHVFFCNADGKMSQLFTHQCFKAYSVYCCSERIFAQFSSNLLTLTSCFSAQFKKYFVGL